MHRQQGLVGSVMSILLTAGSVYLGLLVLLYVFQRNLLYHPDPTIPRPVEYAVSRMETVRLPSKDGLELHGWWIAPAAPERPVILYHHGNAGHIGGRASKVKPYIEAGYGVLLMSYRYNAGVGGAPTEDHLIADGQAALDWLGGQGIASNRIVAYGESLGSGVAVALAASNPLKALVLEAPYSSVAAVAQGHYWYVPAFWLVKDAFRSDLRIADVDAPVLIVHGALDRTIPIRYGRDLKAAAVGKQVVMHEIDAAGHTDLYDHGMDKVVLEFLEASAAK